jgi:hypothetical protein
MLVPALAFVGQFRMTFKDYPQRQKAARFSKNGPMGRGLWVLPGGQRDRVFRACARLNASRAAS